MVMVRKDKSHISLITGMFTWRFLNCDSYAGLWLHSYESDTGLGQIKLKRLFGLGRCM